MYVSKYRIIQATNHNPCWYQLFKVTKTLCALALVSEKPSVYHGALHEPLAI
jgi:hypothetical protein